MKKEIVYYIAFTIAGFAACYFLLKEPQDKELIKRSKEAIQAKQNVIDSLTNSNEALFTEVSQLEGKIYQDSVESSLERSKTITEQNTIKDEEEVLSKGRELYGESTGKNTKRALVASYGAQAFREVELRREIAKNQKVVIENQAGIVAAQDTIIKTQYVIIEQVKKGRVKTKIGWFAAGYVLGVITPL